MALTIDKLVAITKSRLSLFYDSPWDELLLDEAHRTMQYFKNRETFFLQDTQTTVCGDTVYLPCRAADLERIRFFRPDTTDFRCNTTNVVSAEFVDTNFANTGVINSNEVVLRLLDPYYQQQMGICDPSTYSYRGNTVHINSINYDTYIACLLFKGMLTEDGEYVLPDDYEDAATFRMLAAYYLWNPSPVNIGLSDRYELKYVNAKRMLRGQANSSNTDELLNVQGLTNGVSGRFKYRNLWF